MKNVKIVKVCLVMILTVSMLNFTRIDCTPYARCQSNSQCSLGEQCYNGICTIKCNSEKDCPGLPGRQTGCSQGFCLVS